MRRAALRGGTRGRDVRLLAPYAPGSTSRIPDMPVGLGMSTPGVASSTASTLRQGLRRWKNALLLRTSIATPSRVDRHDKMLG